MDSDDEVGPTAETVVHDATRLQTLHRYGVLDTGAEQGFDDIVLLAARICETPVALVSLVAGDRQWFKAQLGFDPRQTPLSQSVCAHGLARPGLLVIPDLTADPRTRDNTLVTGPPHIRFYAGARLDTPDGVALGMLCVIDTKPRPDGLTITQREALVALAGQVMAQFDLRRIVRERDDALADKKASETVVAEALTIAELGSYRWDLASDAVEMNDRAREIFGFDAADPVTAQRLMLRLAPEDASRIQADVAAAVQAQAAFDREYRVVRPDGTVRWVSSLNRPGFGIDGSFSHYAGVFRDTTERRAAERAMRESEERFRNMADNAPMMVWTTTPDGACTYLSPSWYAFTGQTQAEALGSGWLDAVHPDDAGWSGDAFTEANAQQRPFQLEYRLRRADGSYTWAIDAAAPRFGADGAYMGYIGSVVDIDDRKRAEEKLVLSEERLCLAVDIGEIGEWDVDTATDTMFWPPRVKAMFGISPDVPVTLADFAGGVHPDDREMTVAAYEAAGDPERRTLYDVEYRTVGKEDGLIRWVAAKGRGLFSADGVCRRMIGTAIDITARKADEARLRAFNDTLEQQVAVRTAERDQIWQTSPDLMVLLGTDGVFRRVNPAWTTILGYEEGELVGTRVDRLVHPDDVDLTERALSEASAGPLPIVENRYRHKDGSYRWISWVAAPAGELIYATGRHITAEREAAEALASAEEQLRQAQKMEAVGQLTGGIAHDFNNLLTGITGSLEMMQIRMAQGRTGDVDRYVSAAQGAAKRAAALTHRLLAFSRRQTLAPKPTDVKTLVNGMEELISRSVGPDVEVEVVHAAGLWPSLIDPSQLENAVLNLCINARDAMPDGGKITIESGNRWMDRHAADQRGLEPGQYISLCVSDTGTGMTPDIIARVFEPFFTTKPIGMGTGLGLSMIYGFAKQSGGTVQVYSEVDQGTMVCIYLPRHLGDEEPGADAVEPGDVPRAEAGETVLVVDDEPTVRMLVAEVLTDLGYTAIEAGDGAAGLKIVQSDVRIDLLVTDVGLPGGMNGRQVADAARSMRPGLKVLFITGYAENAVLSHGHLDPGMHVLTKPFAIEVLASQIRELIVQRS